MTLDLTTVDALNRCSVSELEKAGQKLDPDAPGACEEFGRHVKKVEAALIHTYGLVAHIALYQESPAEAAQLWKQMGEFCAVTLIVLRQMKERFPHGGTPELYDLALDYKILADEKYQQNLRDSECLNLKIPEKLFPKQS